MEQAIRGEGLRFSYEHAEGKTAALESVSFQVKRGELVAVLGQNGSGKSTLARLCNALLPLQKGALTVTGLDVRDEKSLYELRRRCGMVFQNPDNQFVSSLVEEDVAFGLENYDVPAHKIPMKVQAALAAAGMAGFEKRSTHMLSGGQKQRVALAGVLAVAPEVIIFDEVTAMLDPLGRREVLDIISKLRHEAKKAVVMITHYVEEAVIADRVYCLCGAKVLNEGTPRDVLTDLPLLERAGLMPPLPVRAYFDLKKRGVELPFCPLTEEELAEALCRLY